MNVIKVITIKMIFIFTIYIDKIIDHGMIITGTIQ
jgi:hypothetical protein